MSTFINIMVVWAVLGLIVALICSRRFPEMEWKMWLRYAFLIACGPFVWIIIIVVLADFRRR